MEIKDLDFQDLLQKPVALPFFNSHLNGQLSNQELETVVGGLQSLTSEGGGSELALTSKIIGKPSVTNAVLVKEGILQPGVTKILLVKNFNFGATAMFDFCVPDELHPPYYICYE